MDQTLEETDQRVPKVGESGDFTTTKTLQRDVDDRCKMGSYCSKKVKRIRTRRKGFSKVQYKMQSKIGTNRVSLLKKNQNIRILDSYINHIKELEQRNTQILNLERNQMKWNSLLDKMDLLLQNMEQKFDVYTSHNSDRGTTCTDLRAKG